MADRKIQEWVVLDFKNQCFRCEHCKKQEKINLPMPLQSFIKRSEAFAIEHEWCKPLRYPAGTQIAYIPIHAHGKIDHPDVEFGFVTSASDTGEYHFCRFWRRGELGSLRTLGNSELTPNDRLIAHESVPQAVVVKLLGEIGKKELYP